MSEKRKILIQIDSDPHPSVFDRVVAIDSGVDHLFSYGGVKPEQVEGLVHGAIFTLGPKDLKHTALFVGGSDVTAGEKLLQAAKKAMIPAFGLQVSVLLDANGANTTAAAAVRVAGKHLPLKSASALVLGGTGPVGQRVGLLLASQGAKVRLGSRRKDRAEETCRSIHARFPQSMVEAAEITSSQSLQSALEGQELVIAAGAAGVVLLPEAIRKTARSLKLAIDLNAVPPLGIEGIQVTDSGVDRAGVLAFGAIGVGGTQMKLHRAAVAKLFDRNDLCLDALEVFALGENLG
ncbi:MAG: NAD(P)-dependent methylenetetrahydromethanopterin dehydrogenase [Gemmataceae bacterium]